MRIALWVAQALLALAFLSAGAMKLIAAYDEMSLEVAWVARYSEQMVMFIGVVEVLGGIGVLLPGLIRFMPKLISIAALGLFVVMVLAIIDHARAGEYALLGGPIVLAALAVFVAWGRWEKFAISSRVFSD